MKIWITTDTHWHQPGERIMRPEDHTERQFRYWAAMIGSGDLVLHIGDVTWRPRSLADDLAKLPGTKILVRGNHDSESLTWYMRNGFAFACDSFVFKKVLFTHAPADELGTALLNVHGHLHGNGDRHRLEGYNPQPWHRLLALETTDYKPVGFDKFCR